jgi:hypothetical protein
MIAKNKQLTAAIRQTRGSRNLQTAVMPEA